MASERLQDFTEASGMNLVALDIYWPLELRLITIAVSSLSKSQLVSSIFSSSLPGTTHRATSIKRMCGEECDVVNANCFEM